MSCLCNVFLLEDLLLVISAQCSLTAKVRGTLRSRSATTLNFAIMCPRKRNSGTYGLPKKKESIELLHGMNE